MGIFGRKFTFSLSTTVIYLALASLILASLFIYLMTDVAKERAVKTGFLFEARHNAKLIEQSIIKTMRKDLTHEELKEAASASQLGLTDIGIRVHGATSFYPDEQSELVASHRKEFIQLVDGRVRYLYPILATSECHSCHGAQQGSVLGVIDLSFPMDSVTVPVAFASKSSFYYTMFGMWLLFAMLYLNLRFKLIAPISQIAKDIRAITTRRDWRQRVDSHCDINEVRSLTDDFNNLISTVQNDWVQLEELAVKDPLTGLFNRRGFNQALEREFRRAERYQHSFSIVLVDLDNFKFINDTYGHPAGDFVLCELAARLKWCLRDGDLFARIGGDEFVLILPESSAEQGLAVANKLHDALTGRTFDLPGAGAALNVTASIGVANYPKDGADYEALHAAVDAVLYKAKRRGKNCVVALNGESADDPSLFLGRAADRLRRALDENRVRVALQPIVSVQNCSTVAYEALARIVEGDVVLSAGEFIEAAEEAGIAKEFDLRVMLLGIEQLCALPGANAKMFFNFSAATFGDAELMRSLPMVIKAHGIDHSRVVIEITEREALPHMDSVRAVIDELHQTGIQFALDDFGSGFSSFIYIKNLQVDYLKIDGSFVRQIANNKNDRIIVESIQQIASRFGLKTIAEFVEDEETALVLASIGVDAAQGFHYGKPEIRQYSKKEATVAA